MNVDRISDRIWVVSELMEFVPDRGNLPNYRAADERLRSFALQIDDRKRHVRELQQQIFELEHNKLEIEDKLSDEITNHERHILLSVKDLLRSNEQARKEAEALVQQQASEIERLTALLQQNLQLKDEIYRNEHALRDATATLQQQLQEREQLLAEKDAVALQQRTEIESLQRDTKAFRGTLLQFQQENQAYRERAVADEKIIRALQEDNRTLQDEMKTMHNRYLVDDSTIRALQERSLFTANRVRELEELERASRVEAESLRKRALLDEADIQRLAEQERLLRLELDRCTDRLRQSAEQALRDKQELQRLRGDFDDIDQMKRELFALRDENKRMRTELDVPRVPFVGVELNENLIVVSVKEGGPAILAGVLEGDQIISFNGRTVHTRDDFKVAVKGCEPGDIVHYILLRGTYPRQQQMRGSLTIGGAAMPGTGVVAAAPIAQRPRSPSGSVRAREREA